MECRTLVEAEDTDYSYDVNYVAFADDGTSRSMLSMWPHGPFKTTVPVYCVDDAMMERFRALDAIYRGADFSSYELEVTTLSRLFDKEPQAGLVTLRMETAESQIEADDFNGSPVELYYVP